MNSVSPNRHRDPLTLRPRRTLADTRQDPWAYSEGPQEPQLLVGARPWRRPDWTQRGHRVIARLCAVGLIAVLVWVALQVAP